MYSSKKKNGKIRSIFYSENYFENQNIEMFEVVHKFGKFDGDII